DEPSCDWITSRHLTSLTRLPYWSRAPTSSTTASRRPAWRSRLSTSTPADPSPRAITSPSGPDDHSQVASHSGERGSLDPVARAPPPGPAEPGAHADRADLFHRPLGAEVVRPDQEYDAVDEPEGVAEHQPLHLAVVGAAPVGPGQERPADLDLA